METGTTDLARLFARLIAERTLELPPLPSTAAEVIALGQQEGTDARRLSDVIHRDQAIASNVLRVANSAAYATQTPCASLQQAISRLGMRLIGEIAVAVAVRGRAFANETRAQLLAELWRHSVLTAFFTKEIARLRRRNVEVAFLCGLLHDIGKAVLLNNVERALGAADGASLDELLRVVHDQHVAAGGLLAAHWRMPTEVAQAIQCHDEPDRATNGVEMARSVCLANALANFVAPTRIGGSCDEATLRSHPVRLGLDLYPDQLDALLGMRARALQSAEDLS